MERHRDRYSNPQILRNWDFTPLDPTAIVMVSPPSSPEPVIPAEDGSSPEAVVRDAENEPGSTEFSGIPEPESATTSKAPSPAVGEARVSGKERVGPNACSKKRPASAGNVRLSLGKRPAVSYSPLSSARGELRVSGNQPASAGNVGISEKVPNAAASVGTTRMLPPMISAADQWGGGKWKEDWRTKRKKIDEKTDTIFLKEVMEALIRNSGEAEEEDNILENFSYVEILKSMGIKFPKC